MERKCYICSVSRVSGILTNCPHATYPPPHCPGNKSVQGWGAEVEYPVLAEQELDDFR